MAAIAPTPAGTACCIKRPLSSTSVIACSKLMASEQISAVYSPRLCPATHAGLIFDCSQKALQTAVPAASMAGWVLSV